MCICLIVWSVLVVILECSGCYLGVFWLLSLSVLVVIFDYSGCNLGYFACHRVTDWVGFNYQDQLQGLIFSQLQLWSI